MLRWLKPLTWPIRAEFGWMIPKSDQEIRHEEFERRLYSSSLSFEEQTELENKIKEIDPDFFTSEHYRK